MMMIIDNNNNNSNKFLIIWRNVYIKSKIIQFIKHERKYLEQCRKWDQIHSTSWLINNGYIQVLIDKVKSLEYLSFKSSAKQLFSIGENQLIIDIYNKYTIEFTDNPILLSVEYNNLEMLKYFLKNKHNITNTTSTTPSSTPPSKTTHTSTTTTTDINQLIMNIAISNEFFDIIKYLNVQENIPIPVNVFNQTQNKQIQSFILSNCTNSELSSFKKINFYQSTYLIARMDYEMVKLLLINDLIDFQQPQQLQHQLQILLSQKLQQQQQQQQQSDPLESIITIPFNINSPIDELYNFLQVYLSILKHLNRIDSTNLENELTIFNKLKFDGTLVLRGKNEEKKRIWKIYIDCILLPLMIKSKFESDINNGGNGTIKPSILRFQELIIQYSVLTNQINLLSNDSSPPFSSSSYSNVLQLDNYTNTQLSLLFIHSLEHGSLESLKLLFDKWGNTYLNMYQCTPFIHLIDRVGNEIYKYFQETIKLLSEYFDNDKISITQFESFITLITNSIITNGCIKDFKIFVSMLFNQFNWWKFKPLNLSRSKFEFNQYVSFILENRLKFEIDTTPSYYSCVLGDIDSLELFINSDNGGSGDGDDGDAVQPQLQLNINCLPTVIRNGDLQCLKVLLSNYHRISGVANNGSSLMEFGEFDLKVAISRHHFNVLEYLFSNCFDSISKTLETTVYTLSLFAYINDSNIFNLFETFTLNHPNPIIRNEFERLKSQDLANPFLYFPFINENFESPNNNGNGNTDTLYNEIEEYGYHQHSNPYYHLCRGDLFKFYNLFKKTIDSINQYFETSGCTSTDKQEFNSKLISFQLFNVINLKICAFGDLEIISNVITMLQPLFSISNSFKVDFIFKTIVHSTKNGHLQVLQGLLECDASTGTATSWKSTLLIENEKVNLDPSFYKTLRYPQPTSDCNNLLLIAQETNGIYNKLTNYLLNHFNLNIK